MCIHRSARADPNAGVFAAPTDQYDLRGEPVRARAALISL